MHIDISVYDPVVCVLIAFLIAKTLIGTANNRRVKLQGKVSGMFAGNLVIVAAICALVFFKLEKFMYPWISLAGTAVYLACTFLVKSGISDEGLAYNGKRIAFSDMEFYAIEAVTEKNFRLRIHGYNHEYVMTYPLDRKDEVTRLMKDGNVKFAELKPGIQKDTDK